MQGRSRNISTDEKVWLFKTQDSYLLQAEQQFIHAAKQGDLNTVKTLHEHQQVSINAELFLMTLNQRKLGIAKAKVNLTNGLSIYETALSVAIKWGHDDIICYLLSRGAETDQTYPFTVRKLIYFYQKLTAHHAYSYPCYADNLLPSACFSTIGSATFKTVLSHINNLNPPIHNYSGAFPYDKPDLVPLLSFEYSHYKNKRTKTVEIATLQQRLTDIICEAILRFDINVLSVNMDYTSFLEHNALADYLANREMTATLQTNIHHAIDHLQANQFISMAFANMLRNTVKGQSNVDRPSSSTHHLLTQMAYNPFVDRQSDNRPHTERISELQNQISQLTQEMDFLHVRSNSIGNDDRPVGFKAKNK